MPFSLLVGGISGLAGLFGGGKQQQQTTNNTSTMNSNQTGTFGNTGTTSGSSNPVLSPLQQSLAASFGSGAQQLFNQSQNMTGYTQGGLQGINQANANAAKSLGNTIASRGLSFSPAATTAQTQQRLNTAGQQSQFTAQVPLVQRQLQQQALQQLMQGFQVLPTGQQTQGTQSQQGTQNVTQSGTQTQQGTGTTTGNPWAGLFGGLGGGMISGLGAENWSGVFPGGSSNSGGSLPSWMVTTPAGGSTYPGIGDQGGG